MALLPASILAVRKRGLSQPSSCVCSGNKKEVIGAKSFFGFQRSILRFSVPFREIIIYETTRILSFKPENAYICTK
jgi:hypothetical protein